MQALLTGVEIFVAAAEAGSFATAARQAGLTRSAVARSVTRLEQRLGVRLFQRTTRSLSLTEAGQAYYERCRLALSELAAAAADMEAGQQQPRGRLRITLPVLLGQRLVAPLLADLALRHPDLKIEAWFSDQTLNLIETGMDLAIRCGPLPDSSVLTARSLGHQWMGVYASPAYLAQHGQPADLTELLGTQESHRFIVYSREAGALPWQFRAASGEFIEIEVSARAGFSSNSLDANADAARLGLGLVRLPAWLVAKALGNGELVCVFEEPRPCGYEVFALWPANRMLPLKTRLLIDELALRLPALLPGAS